MEELVIYLYIIPAALIAVVLHEFGHAIVSHLFGDPTPKSEGRLSLNPIKHLDPFGILSLIIFGFGWAKPVIINPVYYKRPKLGMTLVGLAGPLMNFIIAILSFLMLKLILILPYSRFIEILWTFFSVLATINIGLGVFNLIPIPPLDGSKIIGCVLPERAYNEYMQYQKYGIFFMIGFVILITVIENLFGVSPISIVINAIYDFMFKLIV